MEQYIELLEEWIEVDRRTRNNSMESDFDKFCEEKNVAIEALINRVKELEENRIWSEETISGLKQDFIPKSKIREKIEKINKREEKIMSEKNAFGFAEIFILNNMKITLQELLEDK